MIRVLFQFVICNFQGVLLIVNSTAQQFPRIVKYRKDSNQQIILFVLFVDVIFNLCFSRHKSNAPTICSVPRIFFLIFIIFSFLYFFLEFLLNSTSAKNCVRFSPPTFYLITIYCKKKKSWTFFISVSISSKLFYF